MKILLTGADGQVGSALWPGLHQFGEVTPTTRDGRSVRGMGTVPLDLAQPMQVARLLKTVQPDVIVNAAAYTAVDRAESEPKKAWQVNAEAVGQLAEYNARNGSRLIHFSTDYVFSGESDTPWKESDVIQPQGVYGASKAEGEQLITSAGGDYRIFRTAWVYSLTGNNFLKTMLKLASQRDQIAVVDDQIGSPTAAGDLARLVLATLKHPAIGTFHATGGGQTSWCGFARRIFSHAQRLGILLDKPEVTPISSDAYSAAARRPAYSVLDNSKLHTTFGLGLPHWHSGLQHTMQGLAPEFVRELAQLSLKESLNRNNQRQGEADAC